MKTASAALKTLIYDNNVFAWADLYSLHFASGVQRWTTAAADVSYGGTTWTAAAVVLSRPTFKGGLALEVDDVEVRLDPGALTLGGLPMKQAAAAGLFDGVRLVVERAGLNASLVAQGTYVLFDGTIEDVTPSSTEIVLAAVSPVARLARKVPFRVVQAACPYQLYGTECGVAKASFTDARTVATGTTAASVVLNTTSTRAVVGSWVEIGSERRTIRVVAGATLTLASPLSSVPAVGTAVSVVRGCDRRRTTCGTVFSNLLRHGGFADVPASEDAR